MRGRGVRGGEKTQGSRSRSARKPRYIRETAKSYAGAEVAPSRLRRQVDEDAHPKSALTVTQRLDIAKLE
jgi:hypothetical protein